MIDVLQIRWEDAVQNGGAIGLRAALVRAWSERFKTMPLWQHEQTDRTRLAVLAILRTLDWKDAEVLRSAGHFAACGAAFEAMSETYPDDQSADGMLWNAVQCFRAATRPAKAKALERRLAERYPQSTYSAQLLSKSR